MQLFQRIGGSLLATALVASGITLASPVSAQTYSSGYNGLADISYASGPTTIVRGDSGEQVAATINAPVAPGDYVATGPANAELQFDGSSMLRLASNTQVRLVNMAPSSREVQVANGTVALAVLSGQSGNTQIDTPSATIRPTQTGDYRVTVLGNGETLVTVRRGAAVVSSSSGTQTLTPGETLVSYGNSTSIQNPVAFDSFDQFNASRDQNVVSAYNANPYLSPQLAGYSNLANYGQWQNVPGYGEAWAPNSQYQQSSPPYQNGQWVWEPGYGYTWVDNAPYGYTTSHYGTWFNSPNNGGWMWQPPAPQYQSSSASLASAFLPAVVSFFLSGGNGSGSGFDLTSLLGMLASGSSANNFGNATIGWIPLAPGEQYQPWYGQNYSYPATTYSTVPNVTNIYNYYTNARYYRGVTMVPLSSWRNGNFTNRIVPHPGSVQRIVMIRGAVPVAPTTSNLRYHPTAARRVVLAHAFAAPRLAARAPSTAKMSFETQRTRITEIMRTHPHVTTFHPTAAKIAPTVYRPITRPTVHLAPLAPVRSTVKAKSVHPQAKPPVVHPQAKPAVVHPQAKPAVVHPQAKPAVVHPQAKPAVVHPQAKPAVVHPQTHAAPVTHPAPPAEKKAAKPEEKPKAKPTPDPIRN